MILFIYGTTGELIKLMPLMSLLQEREIAFLTASTGQQVQQLPRLQERAGLPPVDVWLGSGYRGRDLSANKDVANWAASVVHQFVVRRRRLRSALVAGHGKPLVIVHGDTMTTVVGAVMGRLMGVDVAHVESGLRSFDLFHPFPEELNRRFTSRVARFLFAPGAWAASNLRRGTVIDTGSNTIRDSLEMAARMPPAISVPAEAFGVVSLHRFELINNRELFAKTLQALTTSPVPLLFVQHPVTVAAMRRFGFNANSFGDNIQPIERLDFFEFAVLLRRTSFVVTDSGGSQEESFYLDLPCLVHRKRTERHEGLGENVLISGHDPAAIAAFLKNPARYRRTSKLPSISPSRVIGDALARLGFAA